tara:strand:+ start:2196 stop:3053 length:858 start_codon:yes stop_codon:yes gene_type:complete
MQNNIELLDGAMGSELIARGVSLPNHIWSSKANVDSQDVIYNIYKDYIDAGSTYLTTNTFRSTPRSYTKIGLSIEDASIIAKQSLENAVSIAKKASNGKCQILGSIAPLEDCYMPELFPGRDVGLYEFNCLGKWLYSSDIDIFLIETMNSIVETKTCLDALLTFNKPKWVSFTLKDSEHLLSGDKLVDAIHLLDNYNVDAVLLNCTPLKRTSKALNIISENWSKKWGIYPNLGIGEPSPDGNINKIHSDKEFLETIDHSINSGATIIGGCCGTNPHHIKLLNRFI